MIKKILGITALLYDCLNIAYIYYYINSIVSGDNYIHLKSGYCIANYLSYNINTKCKGFLNKYRMCRSQSKRSISLNYLRKIV